MNGWVLLIVGLASLGLVLVAFGYVGYVVYRLVKAGVYLSRTYGPPAVELARKAEEASRQAETAGVRAEEIAQTMARLQATMQRLALLAEAWRDATDPYRKLRAYFGK